MNLRNIAIIAHVDHGKTTLVDQLLRQSGSFRAHQHVAERALDRNDLERERGITILAKCTSVLWRDTRINIVDTPGHADFGGEVERILNMVDGALVLVDAAEGVLPQTKFVVGKALARGLRPIVVINKVDRADARPDEVHVEVFDLFAALGASDEQLDFPMLYASGRQGWADARLDGPRESLAALFELVLRHVPPPRVRPEEPFAMIASILEYDPFLGRVLTGRVEQGTARLNVPVRVLRSDGRTIETGRLSKLLSFRGLERVAVEQAEAGDMIAVAGLAHGTVPDTIAAPEQASPLPAIPVDPPTLAMRFRINDGPLAGRVGNKVTSRQIRERLYREAEGNVAIRVTESSETEAFEVAGRGELQLGVLIETMRREGFELTIGRPRVLTRRNPETGAREEPIEEVLVDVDDPYVGVVVEKLAGRRAELRDMRPSGGGKTRLTFLMPSRGLIGYHSEFLTDTRGSGVMNRLFAGYGPWRGAIAGRRQGALISNADGEAVHYALFYLQERGTLFVAPGERVYVGMILGEHARGSDLDVNPIKEKKLTNIRAAGKDDAMLLTPPRRMSLEQAIAYIEENELVEVTPDAVRLRKRHLDPHARKRAERRAEGRQPDPSGRDWGYTGQITILLPPARRHDILDAPPFRAREFRLRRRQLWRKQNMKKYLFAAAVAMSLSSGSAMAYSLSFTIVNNTNQPVANIWASLHSDDHWEMPGRNIDIPCCGGSQYIRFDNPVANGSQCFYDIRVQFTENRTHWDIWNVNLCAVRTVTLDVDSNHKLTYRTSG